MACRVAWQPDLRDDVMTGKIKRTPEMNSCTPSAALVCLCLWQICYELCVDGDNTHFGTEFSNEVRRSVCNSSGRASPYTGFVKS